MRVRILTALSVVVLLSVGAATAAAAPKQPYPVSQQLCLSDGANSTFSTKANSSFYAPQYKKQGVLWTCNNFSPSSTASQALAGSCYSVDGGQAASTTAPGFVTCWKNP